MNTPRELPSLTDDGLEEFFSAELAVLVVTLTTCGACAAYEAELLARWPAAQLDGVALAKVALDRPGVTRFKRDTPWLAELDFLPHTMLYLRGALVEEFASAHSTYLLERLQHQVTARRR